MRDLKKLWILEYYSLLAGKYSSITRLFLVLTRTYSQKNLGARTYPSTQFRYSCLTLDACQDSNLIAYVVALHPGVSASVCYGFVSGGIPAEMDDSHVTFLDIPGVIFVSFLQK